LIGLDALAALQQEFQKKGLRSYAPHASRGSLSTETTGLEAKTIHRFRGKVPAESPCRYARSVTALGAESAQP